ncbi:MAG TPA: TraM recognition domain-containing protein [Pirellulales bacterium]|jgi:hypothetical protein|nr:TraM recognition domain-containing protein [Pirellulales bacterium]
MRWFTKLKTPATADPLDHPLFYWTARDHFTVRHLLDGGILNLGRTGSAKTSSSMKQLGRAVVGYRNSGGLICAAKPMEDLALWRSIFAEQGRSDDLLVFSPEANLRCNFLDCIRKQGGDSRDITSFLMTIGETLRSVDKHSGSANSEFFRMQEEVMIQFAVDAVRLARGRVTAPDLQKFITDAAQTPAQINDPQWRKGFHVDCLRAAHAAAKSELEEADFPFLMDYWLGLYPKMDGRMRSGIETGVLGTLHVFNSGVVRKLVSSETNVSPEDMEQRRFVFSDTPAAKMGDSGKLIGAGWKLLTQRHVLRKKAPAGAPINVIWCDEAQQLVNSFDSDYLAQCRSHLGCMVCISQSLHSFYAAMPGETGKHKAQALLSNFGHRIFHAAGDIETAEWPSKLIGRKLETFISGSMQPCRDIFDLAMGFTDFTGSFSMHYEPVLQPHVFINGLRTGGPGNRFIADAIVIRSGEPFSTGENWLRVAFSQR